jgi:uncharacterized protein with HEPN domain
MERQSAPVLQQILEAIVGIELATEGLGFAGFREDWVVRHAVQRAIEIISEASRRLPDTLTATEPGIPWPKVKGVGNILRHEYHKVQDEIVWEVVEKHLPPLKAAILRMLGRVES